MIDFRRSLSLSLIIVGVGILCLPWFQKFSATENSSPNTLSDQPITLLVTGDVLLARSVNTKTVQMNNFHWPFEKTFEELRKADLTIINLETPLVDNCPLKNDGMIFCGDKRNVEGLLFAGVDVVNFANNHAGNYGRSGVDQTVEVVEAAGMKIAGVLGKGPTYATVRDTTFAFLGYNEVDQQVGVNLSYESLIEAQLAEAAKQADVLIVQFHWGNEYTRQPSSHQQHLAHFAIDHGADVIIGNHSHWWQPTEKYKDGFITYSHGNFIFDQMWSEETREGLVGKYTFKNKKLDNVEFLPIKIENYGQPRWMEGEQRERVLKEVEKLKKI